MIKKPVIWFNGKSAKDRDKFLKFIDTRITKDNYNKLYAKNIQFDTSPVQYCETFMKVSSTYSIVFDLISRPVIKLY